MNKQVFRKVHPVAIQRGHDAWANAPEGYVMTIAEPRRSLDQNAVQWPILQAFAEQCQIPVFPARLIMPIIQAFYENMGQALQIKTRHVSPEAWKDILTAEFSQSLDHDNGGAHIAYGPGGLATIGQRTSQFGKRQFSAYLDFLHATAAERGIELPEYAQ